MGLCISKKNLNLDKLIIENSNDKSLFHVEGQLDIDKKNYFRTIIYFYEDYLYLVSPKYEENISYYKIHSWGYDKSKKNWRFYKKETNNELITYNLFIYKDEYNKISLISKKLKTIICDHMEFINNL